VTRVGTAFSRAAKCYDRAIPSSVPRTENYDVMSVESKHMTKCPACGSLDLVHISMTLEGSGIRFHACHSCEERWWEKDGLRIPLRAVLDLVPKR
jgi:transposase-like protein